MESKPLVGLYGVQALVGLYGVQALVGLYGVQAVVLTEVGSLINARPPIMPGV